MLKVTGMKIESTKHKPVLKQMELKCLFTQLLESQLCFTDTQSLRKQQDPNNR